MESGEKDKRFVDLLGEVIDSPFQLVFDWDQINFDQKDIDSFQEMADNSTVSAKKVDSTTSTSTATATTSSSLRQRGNQTESNTSTPTQSQLNDDKNEEEKTKSENVMGRTPDGTGK